MTSGFHELHAYGQVVRSDAYGIRSLEITPEIVYDIGAQVGLFTLLATMYFPNARIVAVEPHPTNYEILKTTVAYLPNVVCVKAALGEGAVFFKGDLRAVNSRGFATEAHYPDFSKGVDADQYRVAVNTITLEELLRLYQGPRYRTLFKIDIEGEEEAFILGDMADRPLREAAYVAMELHSLGAEGSRGKLIMDWIESFRSTHILNLTQTAPHGGMLLMTKKGS